MNNGHIIQLLFAAAQNIHISVWSGFESWSIVRNQKRAITQKEEKQQNLKTFLWTTLNKTNFLCQLLLLR
jgi:hypothetical protein